MSKFNLICAICILTATLAFGGVSKKDESPDKPKENSGQRGKDKIQNAVQRALRLTDLTDIADAHPQDLHPTTRRWVALASVLAQRTPVLILDEPTASFDLAETQRMSTLLNTLKRASYTILLISHDMQFVAEHADDICVIRSLHGDSVNHPQSVYQMNTGSILMGNPSVGSWVAYGLGSENQNMPAFVVLPDPGGGLKGGPPAWGSGYLSAAYQGVTMRPGASPILDLKPQPEVSFQQQQLDLSLIQALNQRHAKQRDHDDQLTARVKAYEMAFRMQTEAPGLVDISQETNQTQRMYGIDQEHTREFGQRCLLARRMIERDVRFVQLYSGDTNGWDAHADVDKNHTEYCARTDKPVAGLLQDLKQRGLLEDTLIIWGGEFGRMPMSEQGRGRDHNPWGFCAWLAGAGIAGGRAYGATDEIGLRAVEDRVSVNDFHATLLHLLGIDHYDLTHYHNGLDKRLTGPDEAEVVRGLIG